MRRSASSPALDARLIDGFVGSLERAAWLTRRSRAATQSRFRRSPREQQRGRPRRLRSSDDRRGDRRNTARSTTSSSLPSSNARRRSASAREAFEGKLHPIALHTLLLLVRKRREALLAAIVARVSRRWSARRAARETLTLTSARALDRAEYARWSRDSSACTERSSRSREVVDPSLIGGLRIMMGDRRIDATISGRLDALARELAQQ